MTDMAAGFSVRAYSTEDDGRVVVLCEDCADQQIADSNGEYGLIQIEEYEGEDTLNHVPSYTCEVCHQKQTGYRLHPYMQGMWEAYHDLRRSPRFSTAQAIIRRTAHTLALEHHEKYHPPFNLIASAKGQRDYAISQIPTFEPTEASPAEKDEILKAAAHALGATSFQKLEFISDSFVEFSFEDGKIIGHAQGRKWGNRVYAIIDVRR